MAQKIWNNRFIIYNDAIFLYTKIAQQKIFRTSRDHNENASKVPHPVHTAGFGIYDIEK